jgi:hypothetical protein
VPVRGWGPAGGHTAVRIRPGRLLVLSLLPPPPLLLPLPVSLLRTPSPPHSTRKQQQSVERGNSNKASSAGNVARMSDGRGGQVFGGDRAGGAAGDAELWHIDYDLLDQV